MLVQGNETSLVAASGLHDFPTAMSVRLISGAWKMDTLKAVGIVLIVAGGLALAYGGFSYTKETHEAKLGPIELSVKETQTVNVPVWAGVTAILAGAVLLFVRK